MRCTLQEKTHNSALATVRKNASLIVAFVVVVVGCAIWVADVIGDRSYQVVVVSPARLLSIAPTDYPDKNPVVTTIKPGESLKVIRVRYGKDFETLKVETTSGNVGWVIPGDGVKVVSRGEANGG
ncbi:hypothetical protein H8K35_03110 [Undibacterium sp. LX40W]|uniref:SH3 domain-containing protein n=1 Tax=Undibacterium nitidum TaxID=2762298 RepID=A0A923HJM8_9BURK|nr:MULTISPECIES: hypothetical protein [Undibacterium]MBC3880624.1 hypothetical protein [Undibacterium nitidum]MBC3890640.1 hypothetical protein [Undibacterium sp. LX40W]